MNKDKTPLHAGKQTPKTGEGDQTAKKRKRDNEYKDPVIIFVKPWLKPKIKEKKIREKAKAEPAPELQEQSPEQITKKPTRTPKKPKKVEQTLVAEVKDEQVVETPVVVAPQQPVAEEPAVQEPVFNEVEEVKEPAPQEVDEGSPECDNAVADEAEPAEPQPEIEEAVDTAEAEGEEDVVDEENVDVDSTDEEECTAEDDEDVNASDEDAVDEVAEAADTYEDEAEDDELDDEAADAIDETVDTDEVAEEVAEADDETVDADEEAEEETVVLKAPTDGGRPEYIVIKYNRSYLAKLIQSGEWVKQCYSELKNKLLSYRKVKSRISWKCESFRIGRKTIAKLRLRGKTLSLCFAGNPDEFIGTKYAVESLAEVKSYAATPCLYRIKSNRRLVYAKQLIQRLAEQEGLIDRPTEQTDYAAQYPYETTEALIERGLIKVLTDDDAQSGTTFKPSEVRAEVAATEVDKIMSDEVAESLIVVEKREGKTDKTKQGIVNIDTLSACFNSGEVVTLTEIKKRVKGFNKKTTFVKVLARGTLNKALTVEADSFSLQAVKMIVLTGGKVIKKQ